VAIYVSQPAPPVETVHPSIQVLGTQAAQPAAEPPAPDRYLFAFKDHSIYAAVAYWVDGDTLHYFTSGDTHKQAPLSTLDRPFTERLNRETGVALKLPPARQ
jgi:endonuclease YncB( thermonuclease family)